MRSDWEVVSCGLSCCNRSDSNRSASLSTLFVQMLIRSNHLCHTYCVYELRCMLMSCVNMWPSSILKMDSQNVINVINGKLVPFTILGSKLDYEYCARTSECLISLLILKYMHTKQYCYCLALGGFQFVWYHNFQQRFLTH